MHHSNDTTVLAHYFVQRGKEAEFDEVLREHRAGLEESGLINDDVPTQIYRITEESGVSTYVEIFDWRDPEAPGIAHTHPIIQPIWGKIASLCEPRGDGDMPFRFPHAKRLA